MVDRFPNVSFDWLGELPGIAEARSGRDTRRQTLSDLDSTSADSLEKKAAQLIRSGDLEGGMKLQAAALAQRQLTQKGAADAAYTEWVRRFNPNSVPTPGGAGGPPPPDLPLFPPAGGPPSAAPRGPDPFAAAPAGAGAGNVGVPGPQSALPPVTGQAAAALEPSPSDQLIAAAQQGQPAPAPGPQLAGPLPSTGGPAPPLAPQVPGAEMLQGAMARPTVTAPPAPAAPREVGLPPQQASAQQEAVALGRELMGMPKGAQNTPAYKSINERYTSALKRLNLTPEQQSWQEERVRRGRAGLSDISFEDYKLDLKMAPERYKETEKLYLETEKKADRAEDLTQSITRLEKLTKDPDFVSGKYANKYASGVNQLISLAKIVGIDPETFTGRLKSITDPHLRSAALVEQFKSLSNEALMAHVDSLSKSFSDADRSFVQDIFPQVIQTPGGISKIIEHMRDMSEYTKGRAKEARTYMKENDLKVTTHGLNEVLRDYGAKNSLFTRPDGSLTDAGKKLTEAAGGTPAAPAGAPAPPPAAIKITPADEGRTGTDAKGNRYIIKDGKPVPFT